MPSGPPSNLEIPDTMKPMVARMWSASPTFRRQCARLTEASLTVTVGLGLRKGIAGVNAVTEIQVRSGAPHAVQTSLRAAEPEYLAHEIEHVLEHIDGVNLRWAVEHRLDGRASDRGTTSSRPPARLRSDNSSRTKSARMVGDPCLCLYERSLSFIVAALLVAVAGQSPRSPYVVLRQGFSQFADLSQTGCVSHDGRFVAFASGERLLAR